MLRVAWHPVYAHPLPDGHRFPMLKYELIPSQLLHEGTIQPEQLFGPELMTEQDVLRVHSQDYVDKLHLGRLTKAEERRTGFPWSEALVYREKVIMQGTLQAALYAMEYGAAMNVAGGTHHAYRDRGEGFCLFNDLAIAAQWLLDERRVQRVLVCDLDVHQGNGTATIFLNEPRVFTFSMHGAHNYPMHKEKSDLDVPLEDGIDDAGYLKLLNEYYIPLLDTFRPDIVLYQCGVDVLNTDKLGRLKVSLDGCKQRDRIVLGEAHHRGIPVCGALGGGYSEDIRVIIEAHCHTFRYAASLV
jgi:acetoin utilization deacetylase AcuC-like enzyme